MPTPARRCGCARDHDGVGTRFASLDLARVKAVLERPIVVDLRNIYRPTDMATAGFTYVSIGRPAVGKA